MATSGSNTLKLSHFDSSKALKDLDNNGYTVVPNVLTHDQCDKYIAQYKSWLQQFKDRNISWHNGNSLIQAYKIAHFQATWEVRLEAKKVFAQIWGTEKLLSSADAVAISEPPEFGSQQFANGKDWFHLDQSSQRVGLHAYQGGVYLEETSVTDHCFRVLAKSHKYHEKFFEAHPEAADASCLFEFYRLSDRKKKWYYDNGCRRTEVPVPKGGMVLWDSRTVHDNRKPEHGRPNEDRWRFVVFVSMAPAVWATPKDLSTKNEAYNKLLITTHWPSQGVTTFRDYNPMKNIETITSLPDIAQTEDAKLLFGVKQYDFSDDKPNGPDEPIWCKPSK